MQRLLGKLNCFGKAIRSSRAFLRRLYDATMPLKKPHHMLRVTREIREDLLVWLQFLQEFNGVTYIPEKLWFSNEDLHLFTDASGSESCGAVCFLEGQWCFYPWPYHWSTESVLKDLSFLEMVPVILALYLWGSKLQNKKIMH